MKAKNPAVGEERSLTGGQKISNYCNNIIIFFKTVFAKPKVRISLFSETFSILSERSRTIKLIFVEAFF